MAKKSKLYQRLSRTTVAVGSYNTLWLGPDHLLLVTSTGYTEEYRRILLRDIQGIFTVESARQSTWQVVWIILAAILGFTTLIGFLSQTAPYVSLVLLSLVLVALVWNFLMGKGCKVYVITGVQTVQLPALVRQKKTRKVLRRLEPLIAAAQSELAAVPAIAHAAEPPPLPSLP